MILLRAERARRANKACTGRLGLCAFFGLVPELRQFPVSEPFTPQPPVTHTVGPHSADASIVVP
jgi:hypothetical protein